MILLCGILGISGKDWTILLIGAIIGAVASIPITLFWQGLSDAWFGRRYLNQLTGKYEATLKNGTTYDAFRKVEVQGYERRKLILKLFRSDNEISHAIGEIIFRTSMTGEGFYRHNQSAITEFKVKNEKDSGRFFGFIYLIVISKDELLLHRKFTTDNDKENESFRSEESSFVLKRIVQ